MFFLKQSHKDCEKYVLFLHYLKIQLDIWAQRSRDDVNAMRSLISDVIIKTNHATKFLKDEKKISFVTFAL